MRSTWSPSYHAGYSKLGRFTVFFSLAFRKTGLLYYFFTVIVILTLARYVFYKHAARQCLHSACTLGTWAKKTDTFWREWSGPPDQQHGCHERNWRCRIAIEKGHCLSALYYLLIKIKVNERFHWSLIYLTDFVSKIVSLLFARFLLNILLWFMESLRHANYDVPDYWNCVH